MEPLARPLDGAFPQFQQFGVSQGQVAAPENFGLLFFGQVVSGLGIAKQFMPTGGANGPGEPPPLDSFAPG